MRTMADFASGAYNLIHTEASENPRFNDTSQYANSAYQELVKNGWSPLDFSSITNTYDSDGYLLKGMLSDGFFINGNAAALVMRSGDSIVISFRGTNDNSEDGSNPYDTNNSIHPDKDQWKNMPSYYSALSTLISQVDSYVANTANGINKVYVTGHSMGGSMALEYMSYHSGAKYQAVTFAASAFAQPYLFIGTGRKDYAADSRITQVEIAKDPVPMTFDIPNLLGDTNTRPGHVIYFGGDQTLDTPNYINEALGFVQYYGRTANHAMDYYRQIADSVDADAWARILAGTGRQAVMLGGEQVTGTSNFIVDGQLSGTNTNANNGNDNLFSLTSDGYKILYGGRGDDTLFANSLGNQLLGGVGNDDLFGGDGNDTMLGGTGNDYYDINSYYDSVTEDANAGIDTISTSISYTLSANFENLYLSSAENLYGWGNKSDNFIAGNSGDNYLWGYEGNDSIIGGAGDDYMAGGAGDDFYSVNSINDTVLESAGSGEDGVWSSISYQLGANVENLFLQGTADLTGTGNEANNLMAGNDGNNTLYGGTGNDSLSGGLGNDYYIVDSAQDVVSDDGYFGGLWLNRQQGGVDTVESSVSFTLGDNLENLILIGDADLSGNGNGWDNEIKGNAGNNTLSGGQGKDTIAGGDGNDVYYIHWSGAESVLIEGESAGNDTVYSAALSYTLSENIETLILSSNVYLSSSGTGNGGNNLIQAAGIGDNTLDGGLGADTLDGGAGNDTYKIDDALDRIIEGKKTGKDTVMSSISYTLGDNLENLYLTGSDNLSATGNKLNNLILGNAGNNTLDGSAGNDTLEGGTGNDTYLLTRFAERKFIHEYVDQGVDTIVFSSNEAVSFTLASDIENLHLTGKGLIAVVGNTENNEIIGNRLSNTIKGGAGEDTLNGGLGRDKLVGGEGADVFVFDTLLRGNVDTISDFNHLDDSLRFNTSVFGALAQADQNHDGVLDQAYLHLFTAGQKVLATSETDYLLYDAKTGGLFYDADANGVMKAIKIATLSSHALLDETDILLG